MKPERNLTTLSCLAAQTSYGNSKKEEMKRREERVTSRHMDTEKERDREAKLSTHSPQISEIDY